MSPAEKEPDMSTYSGTLSANLRSIRQSKELSLDQVVVKLNRIGWEISSTAYRHWENGTRQPKVDAIPYIAKALGVKPHDFVPNKIILRK